ncbi:MAG TPA: LysM peptidoglycan-binding domain-containing protein [Vicinamibacteria bacterium]|nr:LysM peptidoglycan-binding domain-containing protein [Vicinamibacteria bacterium]
MSDDLVRLRAKYDPVIRFMQQNGIRVQKSEMKDGKFFIKGEAPSADLKNKVWEQIKTVDTGYADLVADISVSAAGQGGPAPGAAATSPGQSYTVKAGDTLSKIAKEHYGDANAYMKIFDANKDKLKDPDEIKVGQVLSIPPR